MRKKAVKIKVTSAAANKMLKKLNEDYRFAAEQDLQNCMYTEIQDVAPVIPKYNVLKNTAELSDIADKIARLKHAINVFNTTTKLPDHDYTIDEALVRMSFLSKEKERLNRLRGMPKKVLGHKSMYGSKQIEYEIANFNPEEANELYTQTSNELQRLQLALDTVNSTKQFDVEF